MVLTGISFVSDSISVAIISGPEGFVALQFLAVHGSRNLLLYIIYMFNTVRVSLVFKQVGNRSLSENSLLSVVKYRDYLSLSYNS